MAVYVVTEFYLKKEDNSLAIAMKESSEDSEKAINMAKNMFDGMKLMDKEDFNKVMSSHNIEWNGLTPHIYYLEDDKMNSMFITMVQELKLRP